MHCLLNKKLNFICMRPHFRILLTTIILFFLAIPVYSSDQITLEQIFRDFMFTPNTIDHIRPMNNGEYYMVLEDSKFIVRYDYLTGESTDTLFSLDKIENTDITSITDYSFSLEESVILITGEQHAIYRHSYSSNFYVYQREKDQLTPVFSEGEQQLASVSPDGSKVSFVYENNLYVKDIETNSITPITTDGLLNSIIYGKTDWVYEEEFTLTTGHYWSPDSRKIAFYRFDESRVKEFNMTYYEDLYPEWYKYKYPKAGEENALVDIFVYNIDKSSLTRMETGESKERYVPRIKWLPNSQELCVTELNRLQNEAKLRIADISSGQSTVFYTETNDKFISEFTDDFVTFIDSGKKALIMSEKDGFMHIYQYTLDGTLLNQVTKGKWEVDEFYGLDEQNGILYYSSTEISPLERQIYSIRLDGSEKTKISAKKGVNSLQFNSDYTSYLLVHSDANTPFTYEIYNKENEFIRNLENNSLLREFMNSFGFVEKEFFSFKPDHGIALNGYKILPPNFKKKRQYPVLIYVYGGPESQLVLDEWSNRMPWFQYLAQHGYIVVCLDNRGTDGRGEAFKKSTYMQLGNLETYDQIALAEYLAEQAYVDKNRIGVFGWSYGGYMSLLCLLKGNHIFKTGIAVAPVTNWRYYDTIYTERFMRTPQENAKGYDENSPINFVNNLKGNLLLIHGMADDNVHFQNSVVFTQKLVDANKQFEMQFYPNKNHGIYGGNTTFHLYKRMSDYILNSL